jgi:hypothetical protein
VRAPLCIDLFCGLGGWAEGFLAEGYRVIGFDIERHDYGTGGYPGQLVIQDVLTLHGAQFRDAACIVASPPCQEYSYMGMPWSRAKQIARALEGQGEFPEGYRGSHTVAELTALFDACFRIQREASEAAGRHIPLVVENVNKAQKWVGRAAWHFGSYYLWGDVPTLMPMTLARVLKQPGRNFHFPENGAEHGASLAAALALAASEGAKGNGGWFGNYQDAKAEGRGALNRYTSSKSQARKAASAMIAKIPFTLSSWIARCFRPAEVAA